MCACASMLIGIPTSRLIFTQFGIQVREDSNLISGSTELFIIHACVGWEQDRVLYRKSGVLHILSVCSMH